MMTDSELKSILENGIENSTAVVNDMTGTMDHFDVDITSPVFEGMSLIEQHKLVHAAVGQHLTTTIHALKIKTRTP
ncbi:MAG: stress-induced morphogen [Planctomycetota bacterium]|jgi:stress-induced morphogen